MSLWGTLSIQSVIKTHHSIATDTMLTHCMKLLFLFFGIYKIVYITIFWRKEAFILTWSLNTQFTMMEKPDGGSFKGPGSFTLTLKKQSEISAGSQPALSFLFHFPIYSRHQAMERCCPHLWWIFTPLLTNIKIQICSSQRWLSRWS